jgi:hypothetical protein
MEWRLHRRKVEVFPHSWSRANSSSTFLPSSRALRFCLIEPVSSRQAIHQLLLNVDFAVGRTFTWLLISLSKHNFALAGQNCGIYGKSDSLITIVPSHLQVIDLIYYHISELPQKNKSVVQRSVPAVTSAFQNPP